VCERFAPVPCPRHDRTKETAMATESTPRPGTDEYAPFYADYVGRVPETDILTALEAQIEVVRAAFAAVPAERHGYRYAPGKWSVRELAGHLVDVERVFAYRALRFARGDATPLPGFDEGAFVRHAASEARRLTDIVDEIVLLRRADVLMYRGLPPAAWSRRGVANDSAMSVRALAYASVGHIRHHLEVLQTRYG
jgi:hypothetical protein